MSSGRSPDNVSSVGAAQRYGSVSGSYNVQAYEAAQEKKHSTINVSVVLLDQSEVTFKISKRDRGQVLLDLVFQHARVAEVRFFGLQFPNSIPDTMRWLDPAKSLRKQFKRGYPHILFLRIKFYATDLAMMREDNTKYSLFLQLKLDLLERKLLCTPAVAALLSSFAVQSELGDYDESCHKKSYISEFKFIANQTEEFEFEVKRLHQQNCGLSPGQAETKFIQTAQNVSMYGVEMHVGYDSDDSRLDIGVDGSGILITQNGFKAKEFKWPTIVKISFKRKQFFIQLKPQLCRSEPANLITTFHMDNYRACKRLWKCCVDFHSFYRQLRCFNSSCDHQQGAEETLNTTTDDENQNRRIIGSSKVRTRHSRSNENLKEFASRNISSDKMLSSSTRRNGHGTSSNDRAPRRLSAPPTVTSAVAGTTMYTDAELISLLKLQQATGASVESAESSTERLPTPVMLPIQYHQFEAPPLGTAVTQHYLKQEEVKPSMAAVTTENDAVTIRNGSVVSNISLVELRPDRNGRYGFNVKGGADQNMDIIISKVNDDLPASKCTPPIEIGDRVLQVNGRDVSHHTHEQIVRFIQSTRESHTGHLTLLLEKTHSDCAYHPEGMHEPEVVDNNTAEECQLDESMAWLDDLIASDDILSMFEALYRKKPDGTFKHAKLHHNLHKNRYRDISPYDDTRVVLSGDDNNYINANHVDMDVSSGVNHYIACQGPLPNTAEDFWTMVWQQRSSLIVMLTALMERGRQKCFQYWPDSGHSVQFGNWLVESLAEEGGKSFAFRDFYLHRCCFTEDDGEDDEIEMKVAETRRIKQMQYIAWPDHGVPDDSSDFLDFVLRVRQHRVGMSVPAVIHCSAGIGRTGVLITMETAMCLIEANRPVYPLQIARSMREQRAMMIQTPGQFKFVCEAILRVFREGLAKPLPAHAARRLYDQEEDDDKVISGSVNGIAMTGGYGENTSEA